MAVNDSAELIQHLNQRREHCRALLELSRRQHATISNGDYDELIELVERKQRVLMRLDDLKKAQPAGLHDWNTHRGSLPGPVRESCDAVLQQTEQILTELLAEEENCARQLMQRRDETRRQLDHMAQGRLLHGAYGNTPVAPSHRFLDVNQ